MDKEKINNILMADDESFDLFYVRRLVYRYPYFEMLRLVYLKKLKSVDNEAYAQEVKGSHIYFSDRKVAHIFIHRDRRSIEDVNLDLSLISSDYFAVDNSFREKDSLKAMAQKLKKARLEKIAEKKNNLGDLSDEQKVKKMVEDKQYFEALKLLKKINLNNSEKNAYFAVQIKYLETILNYKE